MKVSLMILLGCLGILLSSYTFAGCGGSCGDNGGSCGGNGGCQTSSSGGGGYGDMTCSCADPACGPRAYNDCLDSCSCCEAFGNIGADD